MARKSVCLTALAVCSFATGCFSYGYSPYYQAGIYGTVPQPGLEPQPAAPMVAPGRVWVPATPQPGPVAGVVVPEPAKRPAPPTGDRFDDSQNTKPVPEPAEPGDRTKEVTEPFGLNENAPHPEVRVSSRKRITRPEDLELAIDPERIRPVAATDSVASTTETSPADPGAVNSAEFKTDVQSDPDQPDPRFDYDSRGYTWLQGIVERGRNGSWHLVYSPTPDAADRFGGEVTLKPTAALKGLQHQMLIRVAGRFDLTDRDRLGKPLYDVTPGSIELVKIQYQ